MTPDERAAECFYFAMDGLPIDSAEAHIKVIAAAIIAAENDAIDRCIASVNQAREDGETDLRQVREWISALKSPVST